jgi:thioredoxin-related protein
MRKQIFKMLAIMPLIVNAQTDKQTTIEAIQHNNENIVQSGASGIQWTNGLSWKDILKKAKKENKYIFVDCFTTWCGPCKLMDKEVYTAQEVGKGLNEKFISIKVQMDKTIKDNEDVKKWYTDAAALQKEYGIASYPSYLFFSPKGNLIYRESGYKKVKDFLSIAEISTKRNSEYPYRKYYQLMAAYKKGEINYDLVPELIDTAKMLHQRDIVYALENDYRNYLSNLKETELFTKKKIFAIASLLTGSDDKFFPLFTKNSSRIDSVIGKGYSSHVIDKIIQKNVIEVAFNNSKKTVAYQLDWNSLEKTIAVTYGIEYAVRNILIGKIKWHERNHEWSDTAKYFTLLAKQYDFEHNDRQNDIMLNSVIWNAIFKRSADKEQIDLAIKCMEELVNRVNKRKGPPFMFLDTYANILYKAGRVEEALIQEEKGWKSTIEWKQADGIIKDYLETIEKMKQGQPTWPHYIDKDDIY